MCVGFFLEAPAWEGEINARILKDWGNWSCMDCGYQGRRGIARKGQLHVDLLGTVGERRGAYRPLGDR